MTDNKYAETIADEYGSVVKEIKKLEDKKDFLKSELIPLISDIPLEGMRWTITKKSNPGRINFDMAALREDLGEAAAKYERVGKAHITLTVKRTKRFGEVLGGDDD